MIKDRGNETKESQIAQLKSKLFTANGKLALFTHPDEKQRLNSEKMKRRIERDVEETKEKLKNLGVDV